MNDPLLYFCPTPIGNLGDISLRTLEVLENVDLICCEDTRVSIKLLNHYHIKKPLFSYHEHNEQEASEKIIAMLDKGKKVALITDAGMPGISDPGAILAQHAIKNDIPFTVLPGASAIPTALLHSGFSNTRFIFEGFLPRKQSERDAIFASWTNEERTIVFYESPHRLKKTLDDLRTHFKGRRLSASRELTKKFEETIRGMTEDVYSHFETHPIKGEFVLVLEGTTKAEASEDTFLLALNKATSLIDEGQKTKEAANLVAKAFNVSKRDIYQALIERKEDSYGNA